MVVVVVGSWAEKTLFQLCAANEPLIYNLILHSQLFFSRWGSTILVRLALLVLMLLAAITVLALIAVVSTILVVAAIATLSLSTATAALAVLVVAIEAPTLGKVSHRGDHQLIEALIVVEQHVQLVGQLQRHALDARRLGTVHDHRACGLIERRHQLFVDDHLTDATVHHGAVQIEHCR